jgi:hypothetical protein
MAHVFISYRSADAALAAKLSRDVRAMGHTVWLDSWEVNVGDRIVERINQGLAGSTYLVLCYSSAGMAPWMDIEWMSALARQLNGEGVRVLPVVLSGKNIPAILAGTKYADLMANWQQGLAELLRAIK